MRILCYIGNIKNDNKICMFLIWFGDTVVTLTTIFTE